MDKTICKLPTDYGNTFLRLEVDWSSDSFRVVVFHVGSMWTGKMTSADVASTSQLLSMDPKNYMVETRNALSSHGGSKDFVYKIENRRFFWKQLVPEDVDLKIKFGSVLLEEVPALEVVECMLDTVIDMNHCLQDQVQALETGRQALESERKELFAQLSLYQKEKLEMEENLYKNFLDILNAKKKRIEMLENHIDSCNLPAWRPIENIEHSKIGANTISDSDPDDLEEITESKASKVQNNSKKSSRPIIMESSDDEMPLLKTLPKRRQAKSISKTKAKSKDTSKRKVEERITNNVITKGRPAASNPLPRHNTLSPVPGTSSALPEVHVEGNLHYNSDTDIDPCTDDENTFNVGSLKVEAKPSGNLLDCLFSDEDKSLPSPTCILPKRLRHQPIGKFSEARDPFSRQVFQFKSSNVPIGTRATGSDLIEEKKKFNTQDLLDELIN